jgi:nitroreductase
MSGINHDDLESVARDALRAPSVLNTQPWTWRVDGEELLLCADRDRQLTTADPEGRLLLLSCGAALHHARVSLAARGYAPQVRRMVSSFDDDLLARITVGEARPASQAELAMHEAIERRRTDRRPFGDEPVPAEALLDLQEAAEGEGAYLHRVRYDQMPMLAIAAAQAGAQEMADTDYRAELLRWTNRPEWSGDGVPPSAAVQRVPRRVPVRELAVAPKEGMAVPPGGDVGAAYLIVYGDGDEPRDWLVAGEAVSAVLLAATSLDLAMAPISDVIEVIHPRELVTSLLPEAGHPYLVLRCGYAVGAELQPSPRRDPGEAITGLSE